MNVSVTIDEKNLIASLARYAAASGKGSSEAVAYAARQIARNAQLETVLQTARGSRSRAPTVSAAKKEQTAAWEHRIISPKKQLMSTRAGAKMRYPGMRLPRKKLAAALLHSSRLSTSEAKTYIRQAKTRQGELAAAWNAALLAAGGKPVAQYIARHGAKHGSYKLDETPENITATITATMPNSGLSHIPMLAIRKTSQAITRAADSMIRRQIRAAKKAGGR